MHTVSAPPKGPVAEEGAHSTWQASRPRWWEAGRWLLLGTATERRLDFSGAGTLYVLVWVWTAHVLFIKPCAWRICALLCRCDPLQSALSEGLQSWPA